MQEPHERKWDTGTGRDRSQERGGRCRLCVALLSLVYSPSSSMLTRAPTASSHPQNTGLAKAPVSSQQGVAEGLSAAFSLGLARTWAFSVELRTHVELEVHEKIWFRSTNMSVTCALCHLSGPPHPPAVINSSDSNGNWHLNKTSQLTEHYLENCHHGSDNNPLKCYYCPLILKWGVIVLNGPGSENRRGACLVSNYCHFGNLNSNVCLLVLLRETMHLLIIGIS